MNALTRKRVFVVDDDLSVQKSLQRLLTAHNFNVSTYGSAEAFLKSTGDKTSGCVVLDVHMIGMNGLELQKKLNAIGSNFSLIFITADKSKATEQYAMKAGAKAVLQKPFTQKRLMDSIAQVFCETDILTSAQKRKPIRKQRER